MTAAYDCRRPESTDPDTSEEHTVGTQHPAPDDNASGSLPNFLVIGAMRSGTSSLRSYLDAHPEAYVWPGEVHFFSWRRQWERGLDWYRGHFSDVDEARAVGEVSPSYMDTPVAPERIARVVPGVRLIATLRNPIDRAHSHWWYHRLLGQERQSFRRAVGLSGPGDPDASPYVRRGRYYDQLQRVLEHHPRESLKVVLLEELRSDPVDTFRDLCRFLDIDDQSVPDIVGQPVNTGSSGRAIWLRFGRRPWNRVPRRIRPWVVRAIAKRHRWKPLPPETRAELGEVFEEQNEGLARWLERELPVWR